MKIILSREEAIEILGDKITKMFDKNLPLGKVFNIVEENNPPYDIKFESQDADGSEEGIANEK